MKQKLLLLTMLVAATMQIFAQAPQGINYQAVVRNGSGQPVGNGTAVVLKFSIHNATAGGTVVFTENVNVTANQFGLVTTTIGSSGNLATVNWGNGDKFLQVEANVNNGGFVDMGTTQLMSVPYALYAANSAAGPQGPQGVTGPQGQAGAQGAQGIQGVTGAAGATGADGVTGATGATGAQGIQGVAGVTGAQGTQGVAGVTGATGDTGPQGLQGVAGAPGAQGTQGVTGATGATGDTGPQGLQGAAGTPGAQGPQGIAGAAGATGAQGIQGIQGIQGVQGAQGLQGVTGATGATGLQGIQGTPGAQGAQGIQGAQGPQGNPGVQGPQGNVGAQGPQGIQGVTGATGPNWTISSAAFNTDGSLAINTTIPSTVTSSNFAWLLGGNNTTGIYTIGTTSNQHVDFVTNGLVRGRFANTGQLAWGGTTFYATDMVDVTSNATFPWAINGFSSNNGSGVYGEISAGTTVFGAVQGEYNGTNLNGAGVRGVSYNNAVAVLGYDATGLGWAGYFDGDVNCVAPFAYYNISDARLKQNVKLIANPISRLMQIGGYEYDFNTDAYGKFISRNEHKLGVMAQEVEAVFPELVKNKHLSPTGAGTRGSDNDTETLPVKAVNYDGLIPVLIEAVKEQQRQIEAQQKEIEVLKAKLTNGKN